MGILALSLRPFQKKLFPKKLSKKSSSYLVFVLLVLVVVVPFGLFIKSFIGQAITFQNFILESNVSFNSILKTLNTWPIVNFFIPDTAVIGSKISMQALEFGNSISAFALKQAAEIPKLLLQTFFVLISCFYFLMEGEKFVAFMSDKIPIRNDIRLALVDSFKNSSGVLIVSSLLASVSQSIVVFFCFIILGIPTAFLASVATFFLAFIPFIGPAPVWILAAFYLYMKGMTTKFIVMILFVIITSLIDNVVRMIVLKSGAEGLNPLIGLVAVLGGIEIFGFYGVILGPMILTLLVVLLKILPHVVKYKE